MIYFRTFSRLLKLIWTALVCDGENSETDSSLDFAKDCEYISAKEHLTLTKEVSEIGKMLGAMINNPKPFIKK